MLRVGTTFSGGPDLENQGLLQLHGVVFWDLESWALGIWDLKGHVQKEYSSSEKGPCLSSADEALKFSFPWQRHSSEQSRSSLPHLG